jgi:hypothetical protein
MFTLQIQNGDLQIGANGFATVNGSGKVYQDLSVSTLEPYGCDRFHPQWGSLLYNYLGDTITLVDEALVQSEVSRLVNNYMLVQQDNISTEVAQGLQSQYATNEVVASIEAIDINQQGDTMMVSVLIQTVSGQQITLASQVSQT